jgi:hypothetical protein
MNFWNWFRAKPESVDISRRRLLAVLAIAPFAPWEEILKEAAAPKIFPSAAMPSALSLQRAIDSQWVAGEVSPIFLDVRCQITYLPQKAMVHRPHGAFRVPLHQVTGGVFHA